MCVFSDAGLECWAVTLVFAVRQSNLSVASYTKFWGAGYLSRM